MPSFITHDYFATRGLIHAPQPVAAICKKYAAAYAWGAQAFDPLFYHHIPYHSNLRIYAMELHGMAPFSCFESLVRRAKNGVSRAWLFGLCTHYILDMQLSPFLAAMAKPRLAPHYPDFPIERLYGLAATDIDYAITARYITENPIHLRAYQLLRIQYRVLHTPAQMLSYACLAAGHKVRPTACAAAMRDMRRVYEALSQGDDTARDALLQAERSRGQPGELSIFKMRSLPLPEDCANRSGKPWQDTAHNTDDIFMLLENAYAALPVVFDAVWECCTNDTPLPPELFHREFTNSMFSTP